MSKQKKLPCEQPSNWGLTPTAGEIAADGLCKRSEGGRIMRKKGRKLENRRRRQLHQILDLVLDINGMQESKKEKTGNHPTAFLEIYGHVAWVDVQIHRTGYANGMPVDLHLTSPFNADMPFRGTPMSEMIETLKKEKARRRQPDRATKK